MAEKKWNEHHGWRAGRYHRTGRGDLLDADKDEARVQEIGERIVSLRERRQDVLTQAAVRKDEIDRIKAMIAFIE